jgi:hypothetical protein
LPSKGTAKFIGEQSIREIEFSSSTKRFSLDASHSNWLQRTCLNEASTKSVGRKTAASLLIKPPRADEAALMVPQWKSEEALLTMSDTELKKQIGTMVVRLNEFGYGWMPLEPQSIDSLSEPRDNTPQALEEYQQQTREYNKKLAQRQKDMEQWANDRETDFQKKFPDVASVVGELGQRCRDKHISVTMPDTYAAEQSSNLADFLNTYARKCL